MKTWKVESTAGGRILAEVKVQRGIFQGDALSPLLFITGIMTLNHILRKSTATNLVDHRKKSITQCRWTT